ncbi:MAG: tRNA (adenosine(37)-N6)-threonylcarbamoyltransferase complex transferase subunit TsaD [Treponema sp.]|jgi:N6-L-threonylcarbamoyladenine synthase|nr:tRNA (adenosine(37)-N6)-threonylcarbamoyltransferase complex transferase subunit TsaD [Treponema sp.]
MKVLGIESSCDECAAAVVEDGRRILSNVVATQIPFHAEYNGVVPEIASRKHTEWIYAVAKEALDRAGAGVESIGGVAATAHPGLLGSLLVGLSFAKAFAWARNLPFIAVDHMLAHLYASRLELPGEDGSGTLMPGVRPEYPFLGLLVSGGHSIICRVDDFDNITVLGASIDDAVGEAFDKVAKYYGFGYPGGAAIDRLAKQGDEGAFKFPMPKMGTHNRACRNEGSSLKKEDSSPGLRREYHRYDVSYSGLKTAVINQLEQFRVKAAPTESGIVQPASGSLPLAGGQGSLPGGIHADIAASFQKTAVEILLRALFNAVEDTGLHTIVAGGGVAANSLLRARLAGRKDLVCVFPPPELCGDNGAMIAGLGYQYLSRGERSPLNVTASARVAGFRKI